MKKHSLIVFLAVFFLILFGLYLVLSASSTYSSVKFEDQFQLFNSHLLKALGGLFFLIVFAFIPYEIYKSNTKLFLVIVIFLLIATLVISTQVKGAKRWLDLGIINFQPSDLAKIALMMHLAYLVEMKDELLRDFKLGFIPMIIWIFLTAFLILIQPNISSGLILVVLSFAILYVGGVRLSHLFGSIAIAGTAVASLAMVFTHSRGRIVGFWEGLTSGESANLQVQQAIIGLGSGGMTGVGLGHSSQRNLFLPEAYGDFIFAILGEETGFMGAVLILFVYLIIFVVGLLIAKNAKDKFGQMLGFGIVLSFFLSALINASVASGMVPTTGLPLPFISYGGTSMTILCISFGILINIGLRSQKLKKETEQSEVSAIQI
ncbi:MAG: cell division protein FtsW [Ignavibacteriales bacterium]|nr:cell division protein FtsW [Ignavibacteriales bacterium]